MCENTRGSGFWSVNSLTLRFCYTPRKRVQSLDEVVTVALIFLSALKQGSSSMHHVTGQEAVLKAEVHAKCLDADVLHTDGGETK